MMLHIPGSFLHRKRTIFIINDEEHTFCIQFEITGEEKRLLRTSIIFHKLFEIKVFDLLHLILFPLFMTTVVGMMERE